MQSNVFLYLRTLIEQSWRLLSGWYLPGTHITPAAVGLFYLVLSLGVRLVKRYFMGSDSDE